MAPPARLVVDVPLNRVEGDLQIKVAVEDGRVAEAWSAGVMYRGFEHLLLGRAARDGLVLTPRICGICGTAHLTAAVLALEDMAGIVPPAAAVLVRNLALMTEHLQSDVRQAVLMFMVDLVNPAYQDRGFHAEAVRRYQPFKGSSAIEAIAHSKRVIEIIAILGGQWPHSSYMVPGGVVSSPTQGDILQCRHQLRAFTDWYERRILGCSIQRWREVRSRSDLEAWLDESTSHRDSDLGFFVKVCSELGLDTYGSAGDRFLAFPQLPVPPGSRVARPAGSPCLVPAGVVEDGVVGEFTHEAITEHIAYSWFDGEPGGRHPFDASTRPNPDAGERGKYSWAKAPRYADRPAEVGPLAEMLVAGNPLFEDLVWRGGGATVLARQLARFVRPAELIPAMQQWLTELEPAGPFYVPLTDPPSGRGVGLAEASRGALGHWIEVADGRITQYQIVTPTAWNGSPRDDRDVPGPWERALLGVRVRDEQNPVEIGHVVRSFDPCLVCTVHGLSRARPVFRASW